MNKLHAKKTSIFKPAARVCKNAIEPTTTNKPWLAHTDFFWQRQSSTQKSGATHTHRNKHMDCRRSCWVSAVCSGNFVIALCFSLIMMSFPLLVPQRRKNPPTFDGELGSPLLSHRQPSQEIVSTSALIAICLSVPLAVQVLISYFEKKGVASRLYSYMYAMGCTIAAIDCLKRYCGYWRPYYYDHHDYRSFPSGHSGLSAAALGHASLCCLGAARTGTKTQPLFGGKKRKIDLGSPIIVLCLAPAFLALWIAASRVRGADHHPADVVGGSAVGFTFAALFYFRYFPHIFHLDSHLPRPPFLLDAEQETSPSNADSSMAGLVEC